MAQCRQGALHPCKSCMHCVHRRSTTTIPFSIRLPSFHPPCAGLRGARLGGSGGHGAVVRLLLRLARGSVACGIGRHETVSGPMLMPGLALL